MGFCSRSMGGGAWRASAQTTRNACATTDALTAGQSRSRRERALATGSAIYFTFPLASRIRSGAGFVIIPTFTTPARCTVAMTSTTNP